MAKTNEIKISIDLKDILTAINAVNGMKRRADKENDSEVIKVVKTIHSVMTCFTLEHFTMDEIEAARKEIANNG